MLKEKIENLGFKISSNIENKSQVNRHMHFTRFENRVVVGQVYESFTKDDQFSINRLGQSCNISPEEFSKPDDDNTNPIYGMRALTWRLGLQAIGYAALAVDDDFDRVKRCLRADLYVAATPNFISSGIIAHYSINMMHMLFGRENTAITNCLGVTSIPRQQLMTGTYEFIVE